MDAKKIKLILAGIVVVLLGVVIFQNFKHVTVYILVAEITMPMAVMLIATFAVGMLAGWLLSLMRKKDHDVPKS
ncbi:MAG: LapA family protein [Akkermansiaceae bacterium]